jgi:Sulfatase.
VVSLFTGMFVRSHGWDLSTGRVGQYPPLAAAPTLAEVLSGAGFTTHGFHANPYLSEQLGFDRGFDAWRRSGDRVMAGQFARLVETTWTADGRDFAYLDFIGPHSPLEPSEGARARHALAGEFFDEREGLNIGVAKRNRRDGARAAYAQGYRAVVEDTDARVAAVLDALGPHRDDTLVV